MLMNCTVFGKAIKNLRKHRNIKLVTTESRRNYFVSEPNYQIFHNIYYQFISNRSEKNLNTYE